MSTKARATIIKRGQGETIRYPRGGTLEWKVRAADTGNKLAMFEFTIPVGGTGSPMHYHLETEEGFYLVEGSLDYTVEDGTVRLEAGDFVFAPPMVPHTFVNVGDRPARLLSLLSPADFEKYFLELAELANATPGGRPPEEELRKIANRHGQLFGFPPS
jgi:quercetin dioxygenase-like cupin family protein